MNKWIYRIILGILIAVIIAYILMDKDTEKISFMYADF
jgi:hypothetical protein